MSQVTLDLSGIASGQAGLPQPIADALAALETAVNSIDQTQIAPSMSFPASKLTKDATMFAAGDTLKPFFTGARAYRAGSSNDQTGVVPSTDTQVILDAEEYDTGADYDPGSTRAYTIPVTGYYVLNGKVTYASTEDGKIYRARIWKNGAATGTLLDEGFALSGVASASVSARALVVEHLTAGDLVTLSAFHNQAGNATLSGGAAYKSFLDVFLLAAD